MSQPPSDYGYGYGAPGSVPQAQRPTETMAILAIVFAFVFAPLGIVFGVLGRKNVDRNGTNGRGLATAGMWLSIVFTALGVLGIIAYVVAIVALVNSGTSTY